MLILKAERRFFAHQGCQSWVDVLEANGINQKEKSAELIAIWKWRFLQAAY